jgi:tetratricopeptide (TPR) repeat protein
LNGYGTVLYAVGKVQEAKEMWTKAITLDPTFASAYYNMGNALEGEKNTDAASSYYYKALQANPNMADAYYRMGLMYVRAHHFAQAKYMFQRATELEPDAEFSKDALKQIESINKLLEQDTSDKQDVKPKVIAPANAHAGKAPSSSEVTLPQATTYTSKHSGLFKKHKKEKKVDMFIQPSAPSTPQAEEDLKEKPSQ